MIAYWSDPKNRDAHSEMMIAYWSDPKSTEHREKLSEAMSEGNKKRWADPKSSYNSVNYGKAISKAGTGRSWTLTGPRHQPPPGVVVMQPCGYCGQLYHYLKMGQHQNQCPKNPDNV